MSHEGSIIFGFAWYVYFILRTKNWRSSSIFLQTPALLYGLVRIFIFRVPQLGFMKVDFLYPLQSLMGFLGYCWGHFSMEGPLFYIYFAFIISSAIFVGFKKRDFFPTAIILLTIGLIFPFAVLSNHYAPDRVIWLSFLPVLFFKFIGIHYRKTSFLVVLILIPLNLNSLTRLTSDIRNGSNEENEVLEKYASFVVKQYREVPDTIQHLSYKIKDPKFHGMLVKTFPHFLALKYTNMKLRLNFDVPLLDKKHSIMEFHLYNRTAYRCRRKSYGCKDSFSRWHKEFYEVNSPKTQFF